MLRWRIVFCCVFGACDCGCILCLCWIVFKVIFDFYREFADTTVYRFMMSECQHQMFWREHLNNIAKMRCERNAPVDFMGCEQICDKSAAPEVSIVFQL